MRKLAFILAAIIALSCFVGCASDKKPESKTDAPASDVAAIQAKGTLVIGMTDFAPMDYKEKGATEWIGFDADMAKAFAASLGVKAEFIEIIWDNKAMELETKGIDVVWNGMTLTDEVKGLMGVSEPYCKNAQVVVVKSENVDKYQTVDSIKNLSFAVENGSAGAKALDAQKITYTAVDTQSRALMEVAAGSVDACVIDLLMAGAMIGEGTDYANLAMTVELTSEEYGVGFRKNSDLIDAFNTFWKNAYNDGTVTRTAEKYGIAKNIIQK